MGKDTTFSCQIVSESNKDFFGTQLIHFGHNYVQAPMKYVKPSISHPSLIPVCTCLRFQYGQTCQRTPCVGLACHRPVVVQASNCERDMISHMMSYMTLRIVWPYMFNNISAHHRLVELEYHSSWKCHQYTTPMKLAQCCHQHGFGLFGNSQIHWNRKKKFCFLWILVLFEFKMLVSCKSYVTEQLEQNLFHITCE